jgi:hypothetical protein
VVALERRQELRAASVPKGIPGRDLLRFAGTLSPEDAEEMRQAIEEGCEQIDEEGSPVPKRQPQT